MADIFLFFLLFVKNSYARVRNKKNNKRSPVYLVNIILLYYWYITLLKPLCLYSILYLNSWLYPIGARDFVLLFTLSKTTSRGTSLCNFFLFFSIFLYRLFILSKFRIHETNSYSLAAILTIFCSLKLLLPTVKTQSPLILSINTYNVCVRIYSPYIVTQTHQINWFHAITYIK